MLSILASSISHSVFSSDVSPMRSSMRCLCCALVLLLMDLPAAQGQPEAGADTGIEYWIHGGPAVTTLGLGVNAGGGLVINRHTFSLRGVSTDPSVRDEMWEVAFLYGRATATEHAFMSAGVGAAVVGGKRYPRLFGGGKGEQFDPMIGFPLEGHLAWTPTDVVSLGLYAFANVNTAHPMGGLGLVLRFGSLR